MKNVGHLEHVRPLISIEDNKRLCDQISKEEVHKALFQMHPDKAPGPDGFPAGFFQKCWSFMGNELWKFTEEFRKTGRFVKDINNSIIALIPKKQKCTSFDDFRPISLCNTLFKIAAKVLANRLKPLLEKIISAEQNGFVPGREIADSILIISEAVHTLRSSKKAGMIIKLDVSKAYDKVS